MKIRTKHGKGARSGHEERWDPRAWVKDMARTARRVEDTEAVNEGLEDCDA